MITAPVYTLQQVQNGYLEITSCALQPERAVSSSQRAGTNKRLVAKSCNLPEYVPACLPALFSLDQMHCGQRVCRVLMLQEQYIL